MHRTSVTPDNESNAKWLRIERKRRGEKNIPQYRGDSFGGADGLLGYHSLIAAVVQGAEWLRKIAVHQPGIQSVEYTAG